MYRIIYIFFAFLLNIQNVVAGYLNDIEKTNEAKLIQIEKKDLVQIMQKYPTSNMLKLKTFLKETKKRLELALPLCLLGITEIYLNNYPITPNNNITNYRSQEEENYFNRKQCDNNFTFSWLPVYLLADILLSFSVIPNKQSYQQILNPFLIAGDIAFCAITHIFILAYASYLSKDVPFANFISIYAVISYFFTMKSRLNERFCSVFERIAENKDDSLQIMTIDNYFNNNETMYLLKNNDNIKSYSGDIKDFYKWIAMHKNDSCLYRLINCSYIPQNIDNYSSDKLADIANKYQPNNINYKIIYSTNYKFGFKLIEQNKKLTQELLIKTLKTPGIKLIETDSKDKENIEVYRYVGIINDNTNYYLIFAIKLNPTTYKKIIIDNIFKPQTRDSKINTLVVKFNSIDNIASIIEYLFLYLDFNNHTCIYDVKEY